MLCLIWMVRHLRWCNCLAIDDDLLIDSGTVLNNHHDFSRRTIETLHLLEEKGVTICFATGRSSNSVGKYLKQLQFKHQRLIPMVLFNGAVGGTYDLDTNTLTTIVNNPIPEASVRKLIKFAEDLGLVLQYYNGDTGDVYAVPSTEDQKQLLHKYASLTGKVQIFMDSYEEAIEQGLSAKALILTHDVDRLYQTSLETFHEELHIISGSPVPSFFVEYLLPGCNKGECLKYLFEKLNYDLRDAVAFGDGDNDKEMLEAAGLGVAMKNATPLAKEKANEILEVSHQFAISTFNNSFLDY